MATSGFSKIAHDPGDPQLCAHCPFCGSGQITGRSDGGIDCAFCGMSFIVRVQPAFPGMPQAPGMGAPTDIGPDAMGMGPMGELPPGAGPDMGMPPGAGEGGFLPGAGEGEDEGEEGGGPPWAGGDDDGDEDDEESPAGPPAGKADKGKKPPPKGGKDKGSRKESGRRYRTISGDLLDEIRYVRHLAALFSGNDPRVLAALRHEASDHGDMTDAQMRAHMRDRHGFQDSPEDPDWLIEQTHRDEHADQPLEHRHPDLEGWDEELPLSDKDWLQQHGFEAARRHASRDVPESLKAHLRQYHPSVDPREPGYDAHLAHDREHEYGTAGSPEHDHDYPYGQAQGHVLDEWESRSPDAYGQGFEASRRQAAGGPVYNGHYSRGWRASQNPGSGYGPSPLERADDRNEPRAWYDGYLDYATGRPKFHSRDCRAPEHDAGSCTLAAEASRRYRPVLSGRFVS
jgi:hypothetical protein